MPPNVNVDNIIKDNLLEELPNSQSTQGVHMNDSVIWWEEAIASDNPWNEKGKSQGYQCERKSHNDFKFWNWDMVIESWFHSKNGNRDREMYIYIHIYK